jgi:hypothetical protein
MPRLQVLLGIVAANRPTQFSAIVASSAQGSVSI